MDGKNRRKGAKKRMAFIQSLEIQSLVGLMRCFMNTYPPKISYAVVTTDNLNEECVH